MSTDIEAPAPQRRPPVPGSRSSRRRRPRSRYFPYVLATPSALVQLVLFVFPMCLLLVVSFFRDDPLSGMHVGFTGANYSPFGTAFFGGVILRTLLVALVTALITAVVAYPLSFVLMARGRKVRSLVALIVVLPIFVSVVVRSLGWLVILGENGVLDELWTHLGFHAPSLLYTNTAVVIGLVSTLLPFMFLSVYSSVRKLDPSIPTAARTLGATPLRTFVTVTLPLTAPGVVGGATLVFSLAASNLVTAQFLGGAGFLSLPVLLWQQLTVIVDYPSAAAMAVVLCVMILIVVNVLNRLASHREERAVAVVQ
jgi:putative spermidine/putrescine transport system permease protein